MGTHDRYSNVTINSPFPPPNKEKIRSMRQICELSIPMGTHLPYPYS